MPNQPAPNKPSPFTLSPDQNKFLLMVLGLLFLLRVLVIIEVPFTDTTEARYAEIARKMVETNDWITPQFDYGVPFWGKPPLHTWISALGMKCFGVNEFGGRIFIFATACALLLILYQWVKRYKGHGYALLGTVILASSGLFYIAMATVMTDLVMTFGTSLCMIAFWNALHPPTTATTRSRNQLWGYLFFIGLAIGLLAKGPVATVLTALPIGLWVLITGQWEATWKRLPWIKGGILTLVIAVPWYILAELKTPGFLDYFIIGEHLQRFSKSGWNGDLYGHAHAEPRGSIWGFILVALMPWTPFVLAPLTRFQLIFHQIKPAKNPWGFYLLCWAISPMLFFTLATNIILTYVITGIPACCYLAIELWQARQQPEQFTTPGTARFFAGSVIASLVIFLSLYLIYINNDDFIARKSQVLLVAKKQELSSQEPGGLFYWKTRRYYSSQFYSRGNAKRCKLESELAGITTNETRDFIAVNSKKIASIPSAVITHFSPVGTFGELTLYRENPIAKDIQ
ncbi:MAG: glycosyltransferase family 39 protein [Akkermansiaceae bacterium]|nr:glycosyltransferase family 39 protein [Akkermansiaceae bacterium]